MDAIEKAIRNAFEKGNADDRAFREKVYRSAFAALDRALQANPGVTVEVAIKRRKAMQAKIAEIESEFLPAVGAREQAPAASPAAPAAEVGAVGTAQQAPVPTIDAPQAAPGPAAPPVEGPVAPAVGAASQSAPPVTHEVDGHGSAAPPVDFGPAQAEGRVEPVVEAPQPAVPASPEPSLDVPATGQEAGSRVTPSVPDIMPEPVLPGSPSPRPTAEVTPDRDERRARRRFPAGALMGIALLAIIGLGAWWAVQSGMLSMPEGSGRPPAMAEGNSPPAGHGDAQHSGEASADRNWITVFTPSDPTQVATPSDARAEVMQDDTGTFLRVHSGPSGSSVSFDVGQGVLERLAGRHAVFDIVARAEEGKDTQMSVDCNFGELGGCDRKRYAVGQDRNDYLFDVQFPDKEPGAAGSIAINSDFENQGKSVDIYEIRVSIEE